MKQLFATHKILSIIVAVAIIMSGVPLSAAATTADADTATAGVTATDNSAIGLSGEIDPDNGEPADIDQEEQQEEQEPDTVDEDDGSIATSGVTVNNDGASCVCTAFQSDPDCPVCKDDATQCFFYYCVCEALCGEDNINHDCPICRDDYTSCVMAVEVPQIAALAATGDMAGLKAAAVSGGTYTLNGDISTDEVYTVGANTAALIVENDLTLDLNGYDLTIDLDDTTGKTSNGIKIATGVTLTIIDGGTGGTLTVTNRATSWDSSYGNHAAINNTDGTLIIQSGTVNATGGYQGAGIGGGDETNGGAVEISGGTVIATGGENAAGIGGGCSGDGGTITISGGDVTATSSSSGAGIGGGNGGGGGAVEISGGDVTATGGYWGGAGIGGGNYSNNNGCVINISGNVVVEAQGGDDGAGIGGGNKGDGGTVNISGNSVVEAQGGDDGAGIGGGYQGNGGTVNISGNSVVEAQGGDDGAGIGGGDGGDGGTITISENVNVTATGGSDGAGIGTSGGGEGGTVTITGGTVIATGNSGGAGIGSSTWTYDSGTITIEGGNVTATGGSSGAGIGGGNSANGGAVEISGGTVIATGGADAAGIGGGNGSSDAGTLEISGGAAVNITNGTGAAATIASPVKVTSGTSDITLNNVSIDVSATSGACAFDIYNGATVNLTLQGTNTLKSARAGLMVISGATLTITAASTGSLTATGGAAGIGSYSDVGVGTVNIQGGTVTAIGGGDGAGIGGGPSSDGGAVTISGGTVIATGGGGSAGIGGGGDSGYGGAVEISGGTVIATGNGGGAGIGGGGSGGGSGGGTLKITGGSVKITHGASVTSNRIPQAKDGGGTDIYCAALKIGTTPVGNDKAVSNYKVNGSSYTYGLTDVKTIDGGKVYFYLPAPTDPTNYSISLDANAATYTNAAVAVKTDNSGAATLTIPKIELTITGVAATNRAYNGTTTVALTGGTLSGVESGDDVGFNLGNGTIADADVGTGKAVTTAITLTGADANKYALAQPTNVTVNITPKVLTISGISATDRTYNGTTAVALTGTGTLSGIESGDIGSVSAVVPANGTIASANVGTSKAVTTGITLTGGKAVNYTLTQPTVTVDITKKDISINTVEALTKTYDGNMSATAGAVTFTGTVDTLTAGTDYTVAAVFTGGNYNAGGSKPYTYTVTMGSTTAANNYNLTGGNTKSGSDGTINKAPTLTATPPSAITILSTDTTSRTFDLDSIVLNKSDCGTRSYALNGGLGGTVAVLNGGSVSLGGTNNATLTYQGAGQTSGSATQSITITTANYENITVTITFTATDKNDVSNSPLFVFTDGSATYDGSPKAHATATYNGSGANITYSYSGTGGTSYGPTATAPTNAGSYTVTAKYEDAANIGTKTANFTINPRNISNAAIAAIGNQTYTGSAITPTPSVSDSGGTITTNDYTVSYSGNTNVGTATVTLTGQNNYTGTKTATFNIVAIPLTSAAITVTAPAKGGTPNLTANGTGNFGLGAVSWNPGDSVFKGGTAYTATVTLTADSGYTFTGLTTATINGYSATVSNNTGSAVTLSYTFPATSAKTVSGISVKTPPNLVYVAGDKLNLTALIVNVDYDDTTTEDIAYNKTGLTYEIDGTAVTSGTTVLTNSAHDGENIAITYGGKSTNTSALTVYLPISAQIAVTDITAASAIITYSATTDSRNSITSKLQIRSGNAWSDVASASSPQTVSGLAPDTTYEYRIWAKDNTTNKEYTKPVTFKTSAAAPAGITVDGDVFDNTTPAPTAIWVTLEHGNTVLTSVQATLTSTANTYHFSFSNVPNGIFNLVVDNGSWKVTQAVTIVNGVVINPTGGIHIDMSTGRTQSVVEIKSADTPPAAVGGLPELFSNPIIYTSTDETFVLGGGTVEIKLAVEKKSDSQVGADANLITGAASGQSIGLYLDLSVLKSQIDNSGLLIGETKLTNLGSNLIIISFELPDDLKGKQNIKLYRVHGGAAEALPSSNQGGEYFEISGDIVTLHVNKFSTYAIAYTPSNPTPPSPPSPSGGGSSGGGGETGSTVVSTYWIEVAEAKTMATAAKKKELDYVRSRRATITGIRKNALLTLAKDGLLYQHDTVIGNAVQVRVYVGDPSKAVKDILVSGYVKGDTVDKVKARFEKWFTNKLAVVSMEQQGDFGMTVQIAVKVDLSGMNTNNLYFYGYDRKTNKYNRINTEYRIDANGYLHFATILAGDVVVSDGALTKKTEQQIAAGGKKYNYLATHSIHEITNNTGGDSIPDVSEPPVQETPQTPSNEGDSLLYMDTADTPLKLKKVDNQNIGGALVIDLDAPDALAGSQNRKPNALLIGGIAALVLLAAVILWAVVPRKDDVRVSDEEYREKQ